MSGKLEGKVIIVTGGSTGIGYAAGHDDHFAFEFA